MLVSSLLTINLLSSSLSSTTQHFWLNVLSVQLPYLNESYIHKLQLIADYLHTSWDPSQQIISAVTFMTWLWCQMYVFLPATMGHQADAATFLKQLDRVKLDGLDSFLVSMVNWYLNLSTVILSPVLLVLATYVVFFKKTYILRHIDTSMPMKCPYYALAQESYRTSGPFLTMLWYICSSSWFFLGI